MFARAKSTQSTNTLRGREFAGFSLAPLPLSANALE
jgi:hypothetical protein